MPVNMNKYQRSEQYQTDYLWLGIKYLAMTFYSKINYFVLQNIQSDGDEVTWKTPQ